MEASNKATKLSAAYALFLHRSELQRRKVQFVSISQTKIQLTNELIAKQKQCIAECSPEDLEILNREKQFKRELQRELQHRRKQLKLLAKLKRVQNWQLANEI